MANSIRLLDLDYEQLDSPKTNATRDRIRFDNTWGSGFYGLYWRLWDFFNAVFKFLAAIIVLLPLLANKTFWAGSAASIFMFILFAVVAGIAVFQMKYISPKHLKIMNESGNEDRKYQHYFIWGRYDYKQGKDIRIYRADELIKSYMSRGKDYGRKWTRSFSQIDGIMGFTNGLRKNVLTGCVYILVVMRATAGALTVGSVVKYAAAIINLMNGIADILLSVNDYYVAAMRQQSTLEYFSITNEMYKGTLPVEKRSDNEYELEFRNVSFKYPGSDMYSLKNLSLKLRVGQRMAVVGMNGSGKTTMIKLLCRLYDPTEGEITLNGFDIKKYDYKEYMRIFSVVFQDFKLFAYPLGQNVAAAYTFDEIKAAQCLKTAGFDDRLKTMAKGLNTSLYKDYEEDGIEISGGEAQKIALARALYKDAPFIVLDEPTAALDPISEYEIYSKFNDIAGGKTAIFISHRLSSCRFCDDIAVFHEGEMIQRGSHESLLADECGKYHELWTAQSQYYEKAM